jgi:hypothetical protein
MYLDKDKIKSNAPAATGANEQADGISRMAIANHYQGNYIAIRHLTQGLRILR